MRGKHVVRIATNEKRSHPAAFHRKNSGTIHRSIHAEHNALVHARPGDILYVARFSARGDKRNSLPCPECMKKIRAAGLRKVYYTNSAGEWERLKL